VISSAIENNPYLLPADLAGMRVGSLFARLECLEPLELRILLSHVLGLSRVQLVTHSEHVLSTENAYALYDAITRRQAGEPIAYLVGEKEFYGLPFYVTPSVLIPRPETELLVDLAIKKLPFNGNVLDLGTGSGAIAVAIAHARPDVRVTATDISQDAIDIAQRNAKHHLSSEDKINFLKGDWFIPLKPDCRYDLIVSNPPYIAGQDEHLQQGDLRFEPKHALTDGADGLSALRIIVKETALHLEPDGWLLVEHGYNQAGEVRSLLEKQGFMHVQSWQDIAGIERISGGQWVKENG